MYQEIEMYKTYKKEKTAKIKHNHERIASLQAITYFAVLALIFTFVN